jgi:pyruvate dehydrogenase E2 component (dihydrolipoamide acetyltransferase)
VPPRELTMPKLSDSMADAVILRWLKSAGETFSRGDGLIEVETDKATVVYEAEWDGQLDAILAPEGATVSVGEPIATLANGDGAGPGDASPEGPRETPPDASPDGEPGQIVVDLVAGDDRRRPAATGVTEVSRERVVATPVARRKAVELGVSLHTVTGTGPGGRITVDDVTRAAGPTSTPTPAPSADGARGDVTVLEPTPTQKTIARRMVESATTIPVFTVSVDVDVSQIVTSRRESREQGGDAPSVNDFVVKAAAATLRDFPRFNASFVDARVETYSRVNIGVAVATDDALVVPVVRDADRKSLAEIAAETRALAEGARNRTLTPEHFHGGTFTVSNLGMFGVRSFTAIIDPPQVAILAVGGARRAPFEDASQRIAFQDVMTVTLSCDHRVVYGADGARFLARLRELLERPLALAL